MTSSSGRLQDEENTPVQQTSSSPPPKTQTLQIPKSRGSGSSTSNQPILTIDASARQSEEPGAYDSLSRSPILTPNHETGLRRIRANHPPSLRNPSSPLLRPTDATSPHISPAPSRKSSINYAAGPASPSLPFSEDLTRFPSESLHSFSFAHQGSDSIHNRQNVLKRSIDFMREKLGWASSTPRIASAQAKLAGDEELLSIMELLQKANVLSPESLAVSPTGLGVAGGGVGLGPLTGPAHMLHENVFESAFEGRPQSPNNEENQSSAVIIDHVRSSEDKTRSTDSATPPAPSQPLNLEQVNSELEPFGLSRTTSTDTTQVHTQEKDKDNITPPRPHRGSLKRTYTDTAGLHLQHTLTEAMAQPYHTNQSSATIQTTNAPTFRPPVPTRSGTTINERAPHGHRNNQAQAIFTTEATAPWTITAANDLACLVFGVTRAEVRKLGIMEVIDESRRKWLAEKLQDPELGSAPHKAKGDKKAPPSTAPAGKTNSLAGALGNGITAKLLSKPPSRQAKAVRRSKTEDGIPGSKSAPMNPHHANNRSRGVLLCGDVVPIRKMNGSAGSASLWVKEKSGGLIWVLEEIAEDVAFLTIDEIGSIIRGKGDIHAIWGLERVRNGMDVQRLIPTFPKLKGTNTGAIDYDAVRQLRGFTARTSNSISIPITVEQLGEGDSEFRVSSFPHIAGIIVIQPNTMTIQSSNSVFSSALFGYSTPDGLPISDLIPSFSDVLRVMTDEDNVELEDGIVIPEHSFRRARALLAMREGRQDAAQVFLKPSGVGARHRDGSEIMVDVQMRVVLSEVHASRSGFDDTAIAEEREEEEVLPETELVYALWITYSRQLHAVNHGVGPVTPIISRPGTPPTQPPPGAKGRVRGDSEMPSPMVMGTEVGDDLRTALLSQQLDESKGIEGDTSPSDPDEPYEHPSPDMIAAGVKTIKKKSIDDFTILEEMGQGAYGQVKLARYKKVAAKKMVVKYVTKRRILVDTWHRDRRLGTVPLEIHVLDYLRRDGLQHPNIVEMADFFEDDVNYYIEMVPHGLPGMDLFDYIELRVEMGEAECRKIFRQVADALGHLHTRCRVVHRDIKDENVVLDGEGRVKLVDFGSAAYVKSGPFDVFVGTIDYAAPEVLRGHPYTGKPQDVWALGILLYTIVYKENPFYSIDEIMDHDLRVPWVMSEECIDLIRRMLDRDVERRIDIGGVLGHAWVVAQDGDEEDDEGGLEIGVEGLERVS